jgi:hypothetical protein
VASRCAIASVRNAEPQADWRSHSGEVPILRYHVVGSPPPGTSDLELFVTPADFRAQLGGLGAHGYEAVGLETVERAWFAGGTLPAKPIVLSFDGVRGHLLDVVAPELRRRGWPADLTLDTEARPLRLAAVAKLLALGWSVEPSGRESAAARRFVRSRLPTPARNFAFRHGNSAKPDVPALEAAGYSGATSARRRVRPSVPAIRAAADNDLQRERGRRLRRSDPKPRRRRRRLASATRRTPLSRRPSSKRSFEVSGDRRRG